MCSSSPVRTRTSCSAPAPPSWRKTTRNSSVNLETLLRTWVKRNCQVSILAMQESQLLCINVAIFDLLMYLEPKDVRTLLLASGGFCILSMVSSGWMSALPLTPTSGPKYTCTECTVHKTSYWSTCVLSVLYTKPVITVHVY